jgi:hypothetical protein
MAGDPWRQTRRGHTKEKKEKAPANPVPFSIYKPNQPPALIPPGLAATEDEAFHTLPNATMHAWNF